MAKYFKASIDAILASDDSYLTALTRSLVQDFVSSSMTKGESLQLVSPTYPTTISISLTGFTTVEMMVVKNNGTTGYLTVTLRDSAGTSCVWHVDAGQFAVFTNVGTVANPTISSSAGTPDCKAYIVGT